MVFSSVFFLFLFLPVSFLLYFLIPASKRNWRNALLLVCSLFFYFYGEGSRSWVMLLSIACNYLLALGLGGKHKKLMIVLAVCINLGILCYFKYLGFFVQSAGSLLGRSWSLPEVTMPLGISFFTFQGMSYVIDVYRGAAPQKNPLNVALYISLYPQLIAGPIVRYKHVAEALSSRKENAVDIYMGFEKFMIGLGKKLLLANTLGKISTEIFALPHSAISTPMAWLGVIAFSLQLYFDFSGYSDMACGLGSVMGFRFPQNFNYPYCANSITDFWRRWHMTLGTWFRDYLYIPLGGNRKGPVMQLRNILIVWLLTGLWHGASWNFVLWGLYFAVLLILEKQFLLRFLNRSKVISHIYCLLLVAVGWVIFNNKDLSSIGFFLKSMFLPTAATTAPGYWLGLLTDNALVLLLGLVCATPLPGKFFAEEPKNSGTLLIRSILLCGLFALCVIYLISNTFNPFLYFRF